MAKPSGHALLLAPWTRALGIWLIAVALSVTIAACGAADEPGGVDQSGAVDAGGGAPAAAAPPAPATQSGAGGITTYAGSGDPRFSGDGGPATEAGFFQPTALALDKSGNVYLATDHRIRKVDVATGIINTVIGTGKNRSTGDDGPAIEATLAEPVGITLDSAGNIFIVESGSTLIRRVDGATGVITTVAGGGIGNPLEKIFGDGGPATEALIKLPNDVAVDNQGNLYISTDNRVRKIDAATGIITTFAGMGERGLDGDGGPAASAGLAEPRGVAVDSRGNVFIADMDNHRVRKVDASTGTMSTVAGIGKFSVRSSVLYYTGNTGNQGSVNWEAGSGAGYAGDGGPATEAKISVPTDVAFGPGGDLFIADGVIRVRKVDADTGEITTVAASETVTSVETGKVMVYTTLIGQIVSIGVNDAGEIFLADFKNNIVHRVPAPQ